MTLFTNRLVIWPSDRPLEPLPNRLLATLRLFGHNLHFLHKPLPPFRTPCPICGSPKATRTVRFRGESIYYGPSVYHTPTSESLSATNYLDPSPVHARYWTSLCLHVEHTCSSCHHIFRTPALRSSLLFVIACVGLLGSTLNLLLA